jgi:DNA-binding CsgD family transcriptional regulator
LVLARGKLNSMLLGRDRERKLIATALDQACAGSSRTIVIRGDAGIGKSALLTDTIQHLRQPMNVLLVAGIEAESDISFAGLLSLLHPILHLVDELPPAQIDAIHTALAMNSRPTNPLAVGAATLGLLARAAEQMPVLIAIDDAQWLDEPTACAVGFALHRFDADSVAGLVTIRSDHASPLTEMGFTAVDLTGLDQDSAYELMSRHSSIAREVANRCHEASAGNPLALIEIGTGLDPNQRHGSRELDEALPIGRRLTKAFGSRIAAISEPAQHAVLIAALADRPGVATILAALTACGGHQHALLEAEQAGIIAISDGELTFAHPLLRAAAVAHASASQRRSAHQVLATVLVDHDGDHDRYSWHLAGAAVGPDEIAARALETAAATARSRGGPSSAATALERAARLSPDPSEGARRLIAAGDAHWDASGPHLALSCWHRALLETPDPLLHAGIVGRIGEAKAWFVDSVGAVTFLVEESVRLRPFDVPGAVGLLVRASMMSGLVGDMGRAVTLADDAVALAEADERLVFAGRAARALARLNHGAERDAIDDLALVDSLVATVKDADGTVLMFLQIAAFSQMIREDWDRARATLATVIENARRTGMHAVVAFACAVRAEIGWRTGRWAEARTDADAAIAFSRAVSSKNASFGHAVLARIDACMGDESACRLQAGAAQEMAAKVGMASLQMWSDSAVGLLELSHDRHAAAVAALGAVAATGTAGQVYEPGFLWWQADLAEAAIAAGVPEYATRTMANLIEQQPRTGRVWTTVAIERVHGLLDRAHADEHFDASVTAATQLGAPFERARTQLCWAHSNLTRHPVQARRDAAAAMEIFHSLGARPWSSKCEAVLGLRGVDDSNAHAIAGQLTAAELRVALAIGTGASSRDAAEQLYVSVRTVEFHLNNIYRRLGVRSRTELALLLERERRLLGER